MRRTYHADYGLAILCKAWERTRASASLLPGAAGKQADLMVVKGNPAANILDIEKVEIVFKDGVGYDSEKLIQSVQGLVGIR